MKASIAIELKGHIHVSIKAQPPRTFQAVGSFRLYPGHQRCVLTPACQTGGGGRSWRRSEGNPHSRAFLSTTQCFSGGVSLPLGPSPCLVGRDGHCRRPAGTEGRCVTGQYLAVWAARPARQLPSSPSQSISGQSAGLSAKGRCAAVSLGAGSY